MTKKVAVFGSGVMGSDIAYLCAWKGYDVSVTEIDDELLEQGMKRISGVVASGVKQGKLTPLEAKNILMRIKGTTEICCPTKGVLIVIEAISEDMSAKKRLFKQLDSQYPPHVVFASNTSALSIQEMSTATERRDRFIGMHFFNPAYAMKLVEVIVTKSTSEETKRTASDFAVSLGKQAVVSKDTPGFIVNRILSAALSESILVLQEGVASAEDIDKAVTLGLNWPMGPLRLADFTGLDIVLETQKTICRELGEKYSPPSLLQQKVKAGHLGVKTKEGFYSY